MSFILGVVIGLVVGWFLVPQPEWAAGLWDKFVDWWIKTTGL